MRVASACHLVSKANAPDTNPHIAAANTSERRMFMSSSDIYTRQPRSIRIMTADRRSQNRAEDRS
jgi:hypothetical protein